MPSGDGKDMLIVGREAYTQEDYYTAKPWLELAVVRVESDSARGAGVLSSWTLPGSRSCRRAILVHPPFNLRTI